jgi:hypothetical protein
MKNSIFTKPGATLAVAAILAVSGVVNAEKVITREVTSNGTISSFEPQGFVVRSEAAAPTTYSYTKSTQYVDEAGNVVTRESITPDVPVTVHYIREGDQLVADRVVVHKTTTTTTIPGRPLTHKEEKALREAREHPEREARRAAKEGKPFPPEDPSQPRTITSTTETMSDGTVNTFSPDQFVVMGGNGERIVYRVSNATQYVDEAGAPVAAEVVRSGVPVTVTYATEGSGRMAQRVVVHTRVSR